MSTAVIGATGRIGSEIVRGLRARGEAVTALVRDPGKSRRAFGEPGGLHIRPTRLDDPRDLPDCRAMLVGPLDLSSDRAQGGLDQPDPVVVEVVKVVGCFRVEVGDEHVQAERLPGRVHAYMHEPLGRLP